MPGINDTYMYSGDDAPPCMLTINNYFFIYLVVFRNLYFDSCHFEYVSMIVKISYICCFLRKPKILYIKQTFEVCWICIHSTVSIWGVSQHGILQSLFNTYPLRNLTYSWIVHSYHIQVHELYKSVLTDYSIATLE